MIECGICHKWFKSLNSHIRIHGVSCREYKALFPNSSLISEELRVKKSQIQKLLRADPASTFNTPEYIKKHREVTVNSSKWLDSVSQAIKKHRADPNSAYNTPEYTQKQSDSHKEAWANPESGYNSPEFAKSISETVTRRFEDDPTYSKRVGIAISKLHADPNSTYNSPEFRETLCLAWADPNSGHHTRRQGGGFGVHMYAPDGHWCESRHELIFDKWLIEHNVEHLPHPRIPGTRKKADQLVNGHYIEIDGMRRTNSYWEERYEKTNISHIIIKAEELTHILNDNLLRALEGKN